MEKTKSRTGCKGGLLMLKDFVKAEKPQDEELKQRIREAGEKLAAQQNQIKEHKIPVLVLMEGWGTAG